MEQQIGENSWVFFQKLRVFGVPMGTRMTVCRDEKGRLFVHSPNALTEDIQRRIASLGTVAVLFSPNIYHHMYVGDWQKAWPDAVHVAPQQLAAKRPDLQFHHLLDDRQKLNGIFAMACPGFDAVTLHPLRGTQRWHEWECFFGQDQLLILTDLVFNLQEHENPELKKLWPRIYGLITGQRNKLCLPMIHHLLVKDTQAFRRSASEVLESHYEVVVLAHGALPSAQELRRLLPQTLIG